MTDSMISGAQAACADGPPLLAVARACGAVRVTPSHRHARGQLLGAAHRQFFSDEFRVNADQLAQLFDQLFSVFDVFQRHI